MRLTEYRLGDLIEQRREKNNNYVVPIRGVSKEGFIDAKQPGADTSLYNTFYRYDFVFNPARMEINSIALNIDYEKAICSSLYEIFYVKDTNILLPEYLNLYIKRNEFARLCEFIGWGSAREYCRVGDISNLTIELPTLKIQQKYVDVYNAMLANQRSYERGLEDLKLVCDGYIEDLRRKMPCERIGKYIQLSEDRNEELKYGITDVRGISIGKRFIETKADMQDVGLKPYYIIHPDEFAYVTVTSRNGEKISLAHNGTEEIYICSSSYIVFRSVNTEKLYPKYLKIFFSRTEFDRYARFNSWGSARETFNWEDMCDVEIFIPDIKVQHAIAVIYTAYITRKEINEKLKAQLKDLCPVLIKGSLEEAKKA